MLHRRPKPAQAYPAVTDFQVVFGAERDFGVYEMQAMYNRNARPCNCHALRVHSRDATKRAACA